LLLQQCTSWSGYHSNPKCTSFHSWCCYTNRKFF